MINDKLSVLALPLLQTFYFLIVSTYTSHNIDFSALSHHTPYARVYFYFLPLKMFKICVIASVCLLFLITEQKCASLFSLYCIVMTQEQSTTSKLDKYREILYNISLYFLFLSLSLPLL